MMQNATILLQNFHLICWNNQISLNGEPTLHQVLHSWVNEDNALYWA